jgi:hypothetical protein
MRTPAAPVTGGRVRRLGPKDTSEATEPCTVLAAPAIKETVTVVAAALRRLHPRGSYDFLRG